jgi:DNA (cytosine-5)-methyltransferase 1
MKRRASANANLFEELIVDNFAGGGGASMGIEDAIGRAVDIAINHDRAALEMHLANHPHTRHICEDVWAVDPIEVTGGRPVGLAWFSPDCKHFSRAKGSKPVDKKIRGLAWVAVKWARAVRPRVIVLENVREFEQWGPLTAENMPCPVRKGLTFRRFTGSLRNAGYAVEWQMMNAADYGAPTHRRRLFLIARCDGLPIVWPAKSHGPGLKPYRTAAECIDWSIPCPSIFERKRPLAEKTLRRIAMGIMRYVVNNSKPFIVRVQHGGDEFRGQSIDKPLGTVTAKHGYGLVSPHITKFRGQSVGSAPDAPLPTVTSGEGAARPAGAAHAMGVVAASLVQSGYGERDGQEPRANSIDTPLGTVVGRQKHAMVSALLSKYHGQKGNESRCATPDAPLKTLDTSNRYGFASATIIGVGGAEYSAKPRAADAPKGAVLPNDRTAITVSHLTQFRGTNRGGGGDPHEPMPAITAQGLHIAEVRSFLIKYYTSGKNILPVDGPAPTITTHDRIGLVTVEGVDYAIVDIGLRMLTPRELAHAQGFPESYILTGPKSNQVAKIGNSVCPPVVTAIVRCNMGDAQQQEVA